MITARRCVHVRATSSTTTDRQGRGEAEKEPTRASELHGSKPRRLRYTAANTGESWYSTPVAQFVCARQKPPQTKRVAVGSLSQWAPRDLSHCKKRLVSKYSWRLQVSSMNTHCACNLPPSPLPIPLPVVRLTRISVSEIESVATCTPS